MKDTFITQEETTHDFGHGVVVTMTPEAAKQLFHDLNRTLSLLDEVLQGEKCESDQGAYDRLDQLACAIEKELET